MCGFLDRGLLGVEMRECRGGRGWVGGFGEEGGGWCRKGCGLEFGCAM